MIYLFGTEDQVSVIMNERFLTKEQRAKSDFGFRNFT